MTGTAGPAARRSEPRIQRVIPIGSPRFIPPAGVTATLDWAAVFGRSAPLALEIGCGTGHFILELARRQPDTDFLAIDIYNKGCLKTCRKLDAADVSNVRVLRIEARELLLTAIAPACLRAVYINCPDPWPKKRHRDRRLVNRDFLELALRRLMPGGDFFFASDQGDYAEQVAALLDEMPGWRNRLARPLLRELPGYPLSKYMRRFLDQGLPIHFIHRQRDPALELTEIHLPDLQRGFRSQRPGKGHD